MKRLARKLKIIARLLNIVANYGNFNVRKGQIEKAKSSLEKYCEYVEDLMNMYVEHSENVFSKISNFFTQKDTDMKERLDSWCDEMSKVYKDCADALEEASKARDFAGLASHIYAKQSSFEKLLSIMRRYSFSIDEMPGVFAEKTLFNINVNGIKGSKNDFVSALNYALRT